MRKLLGKDELQRERAVFDLKLDMSKSYPFETIIFQEEADERRKNGVFSDNGLRTDA